MEIKKTHKIKIAHESPLSIFEGVQEVTDYDYALANLYWDIPGYSEKFKQAKAKGREIILDNAVFELGESFKEEEFVPIIRDLEPSWYIIPDVLENKVKTVENVISWNKTYRHKVPGKTIGVVQGNTYEDIVDCYKSLDSLGVDMIAISFDYSLYEKLAPHKNKFYSWMMGRILLLGMMERDNIINLNKPHHLLGNALPIEGKFHKGRNYLYSIDTSNPIVHALHNVTYEKNWGLYTKQTQKLYKLIDFPEDEIDTILVNWNIQEFKKYWDL